MYREKEIKIRGGGLIDRLAKGGWLNLFGNSGGHKFEVYLRVVHYPSWVLRKVSNLWLYVT